MPYYIYQQIDDYEQPRICKRNGENLTADNVDQLYENFVYIVDSWERKGDGIKMYIESNIGIKLWSYDNKILIPSDFLTHCMSEDQYRIVVHDEKLDLKVSFFYKYENGQKLENVVVNY